MSRPSLQVVRASARAVIGLAGVLAISSWPAATQNVEAGADVFKKCRACHDVGPDAKNKVGPQLNGVIGRKSGTVEGFAYSEANKKAGTDGLVWTEAELDKYLADPRAYMPGNKMAFVGLKDAQDRKDILAYLKTFK
jgi:cytochrome c